MEVPGARSVVACCVSAEFGASSVAAGSLEAPTEETSGELVASSIAALMALCVASTTAQATRLMTRAAMASPLPARPASNRAHHANDGEDEADRPDDEGEVVDEGDPR